MTASLNASWDEIVFKVLLLLDETIWIRTCDKRMVKTRRIYLNRPAQIYLCHVLLLLYFAFVVLWTLANQYHFTTWQLEQQLKLPEYANTVFFLLLVGKQWLWIFKKGFHIIFVFLNANKMVCINLCNFWDHFIQFSFNKRR